MCKLVCFYWAFLNLILLLAVEAHWPVVIFPPTAPTRIQWINGIGIPLQNLKFEAVTTGYVFKAEYFLPDNVTQLRTPTFTTFMSRKIQNRLRLADYLQAAGNVPQKSAFDFYKNHKQALFSSYRWTIYKGLEGLANSLGLSGRECVLKSICEAAETPFHYFNGLFAELLHILLTPSESADKLSMHSDNEYYHAEYLGRSGANCHGVFKHCPRSLLDHFSNVHNLSQGVFDIMG